MQVAARDRPHDAIAESDGAHEDADPAAPRQIGLGRSGARDFDRPLNARGRKAARGDGRARCARSASASTAILASPAARVVETLDELAEGYGGRIAAAYDERIYLASAETLLDLVREHGRRASAAAASSATIPGSSSSPCCSAASRRASCATIVAVKYPTGDARRDRACRSTAGATSAKARARSSASSARAISIRQLGPDED